MGMMDITMATLMVIIQSTITTMVVIQLCYHNTIRMVNIPVMIILADLIKTVSISIKKVINVAIKVLLQIGTLIGCVKILMNANTQIFVIIILKFVPTRTVVSFVAANQIMKIMVTVVNEKLPLTLLPLILKQMLFLVSLQDPSLQ